MEKEKDKSFFGLDAKVVVAATAIVVTSFATIMYLGFTELRNDITTRLEMQVDRLQVELKVRSEQFGYLEQKVELLEQEVKHLAKDIDETKQLILRDRPGG